MDDPRIDRVGALAALGVGAVPALSLRAWPVHPGAVLWSGLLVPAWFSWACLLLRRPRAPAP